MAKKYIMFIGLNDQETKAQEITTLDAYKVASNLLCEHIGYGTITEARGVYTHGNGEIVEEVTLRVEVSGAELEAVKRFCVAVKVALNQESIGLEVVDSEFDFI